MTEKEMFRRVVARFWPETRRLLKTAEEKCAALYLLTGPDSHASGLYRLDPIQIETYASMDEDTFLESVTDGPLSQIATYDRATGEILIYRMASHQIGPLHGKDRRIQWLEKHIKTIRSMTLRSKFRDIYEADGWNLDFDGIAPTPTGGKPSNGAKKEGAFIGASKDQKTTDSPKGHRQGHSVPLTKPYKNAEKEGAIDARSQGAGNREQVLLLWL